MTTTRTAWLQFWIGVAVSIALSVGGSVAAMSWLFGGMFEAVEQNTETNKRQSAAIERNKDRFHAIELSSERGSFTRADWEVERRKLVEEFNTKVDRIETMLRDILDPLITSYASRKPREPK